MPKGYTHPKFIAPPAPKSGKDSTKVAIVGAGPVGLTVAIDLAQRGISVILLDDGDTTSHGSRLICMSKRTLEIFDRIGIGKLLEEKGVIWNKGRLFFQDDEIYNFDLLPEPGHAWPAFINIQQYYVEDFLVQKAETTPGIELRWKHAVVGLEVHDEGASLGIETPDGAYKLDASYVIACDGAHSNIRKALNLPFVGRAFDDRFLITDVFMKANFPSERWFWFEPPFHDGQSALLHKQPDGVWRIDLQIAANADPEEEIKEDKVRGRIERMLGSDIPFEIEWISLYSFRCRRLEKFRHNNIFFAGDSAHQVSPFGARGGNGGVQDADNLAWKLAKVIKGEAPDNLLDSYDAERIPAADENIKNSSRSTDFMTPKSDAVKDFRDAVLALAKKEPFARKMVNSGRLSVPARYDSSSLITFDTSTFNGDLLPGSAAVDAPILIDGREDWLLKQIGQNFTIMTWGPTPPNIPTDISVIQIGPENDPNGLIKERYNMREGTTYLFRPDQHVAARTHHFSQEWLTAALARSTGRH